MKQKLFTFLLAIVTSSGIYAADVYTKGYLNGIEYTLYTNLTASVTGRDKNTTITTANIPEAVSTNDYTFAVTSIGEFVFSYCSSLTSVTIPNSVTSIGMYAFSDCSRLTSVTIGNGVKSIGYSAFRGCDGLTSVTIPKSVTSIEEDAFSGCSSLTSIDVASDNPKYCSVDGIVFNKDKTELVQCPGAKNGVYTIPNSVTSIGPSAFYYCTGLTSVTIPNSVTSINWGAFYKCTGLTSVTIPNSVTSIGGSAFAYCSGLTSVTIPNSVTSIGSSAFAVCTGLTSVTIPNSVTSIGDGAFSDCSSLTSIDVASDNSEYCSVDGIVFNKDKTELVQCPGAKNGVYTIPNSVTSIVDEAFYGCSGLTSVTIPNSVTSIGRGAFEGCTGLTSLTIPNSVTSLESNAFENCSGLTSVTIPNSVTRIGDYAFEDCSGLTSVTIPNSVTRIGERAFWDCTGLTSVTIPNSVTSIESGAFEGCTGLTSVTNYASTPQNLGSNVWDEVDKSTCVLYVPQGSINAYKVADQWKDFTNILPIGAQPAEVTTTTVTPSATTADIAWPQVTGADTYTIDIKKNGELICTLTFDEEGHLINLSFAAPARYNAPQQTQAAGFAFTVTSLDSGTTYSYTMTAKGNNGNVLKTESGSFTTTGDAQGIEDVQGNNVQCTKIVHNGQVFILRGDKIYNAQGALVK